MKLSVCIPAYNHGKYISQAIDSVLMQQVDFDYEILIGEDDSSDGTREIVKEYKDKYPERIRLFLNDRKNVMYIDGRPTGRWNVLNLWKRAEGKYIALLDGDDYWTKADKLQKQVDFLDNHPECSICFHNATIIYEDENRSPREFCPPDQKPILNLEDIFEKNMIPSASVMFRRGLFGEFPEWYFRLSFGDWPIHILNMQYGSAGYLNEVMSVYRIHKKSMSRDRIKMTSSKIEMYDYLNEYFNNKYERVLKRCQMFYKAELRAEYCKDALHSIYKAAKLNPDDMNIWQVLNRILLEGEWMFTKGDRTIAHSVLNDIVNMRPEYALAHVTLGILYFLDGEKLKAINNFDNALEIYRKAANDCIEREGRVRGLLMLNTYYRRLGVQSKAEELYREIMNCVKDDSQTVKDYRVMTGLGDLFMARARYSEAVEKYRAAIDSEVMQGEEKHQLLLNLGRAYSYLYNHQAAEKTYREALSDEKISAELQAVTVLELGKCYAEQGDKSSEEQVYIKALTLENLPGIWRYRLLNRLGNIYLSYGRHDDAISKFSEALSLEGVPEKDRYHALIGGGKCCLYQGDIIMAAEHFEEAFSFKDITDESRCFIAAGLIDCYLMQGKLQEVENTCTRVLSLKGISDDKKRNIIMEVKQKIKGLTKQCGGIHA